MTNVACFPQHGNGIMIPMAEAGLIKVCEMKNVLKCKYAHWIIFFLKSESNIVTNQTLQQY